MAGEMPVGSNMIENQSIYYDQYGLVGSKIDGSRFVRDYCKVCHEPIRLTCLIKGGLSVCNQCDGHFIKGGHGYPIDDITGAQANAIREMEGD